MNPINGSTHTLNCQQITLIAVSFLAGVALTAIGAYLTLVVSPAIAYTVLGAGSFAVITPLIYLAVTQCKKKKVEAEGITVENPPPQPEKPKQEEPIKVQVEEEPPKPVEKKPAALESSSEEESTKESSSDEFELSVDAPLETDDGPVPVHREKIKLINIQLYQPSRKLLLQYCKQVGGKEEALKLLQKKGKEAGDYTFYQNKPDGNQFVLCVLDGNMNVHEVEIDDPTVYSGDIYNRIYEQLRYPLLPNEPEVNASAIHSSWMGFKNFALFKEIDSQGVPARATSLGIIQEFAAWLKGSHKKIRFNPSVFFKIVGHTFGLTGKYAFEYKGANVAKKQKYEINYEGFTGEMGRSVIMQDILHDLKHTTFSSDIKAKIAEMCRCAYVVGTGVHSNPPISKLLEMLDKDIPITFITGWNEHSVNITMSKKRLMFSNKGGGAGQQPGMRVFNIKDPVTEAKLLEIVKLNHEMSFPADGHVSPLEKILNLKFVKTIPSSFQKVGCCVFANNRKSYQAAAILLGVDEQTASQEFKAARQRMRVQWLESMFALVDKEEDDDDLKTELYFFFLSLTFKLVTKKTYRKEHPHDRQILDMIDKKVQALQKEKEHPYLKKVLKVLAGDTQYADLPKTHQKIIEELINRSAAFYQLKSL